MIKLIAAAELAYLFEAFAFVDSHLSISLKIKDRHMASAQICCFENEDYIGKRI